MRIFIYIAVMASCSLNLSASAPHANASEKQTTKKTISQPLTGLIDKSQQTKVLKAKITLQQNFKRVERPVSGRLDSSAGKAATTLKSSVEKQASPTLKSSLQMTKAKRIPMAIPQPTTNNLMQDFEGSITHQLSGTEQTTTKLTKQADHWVGSYLSTYHDTYKGDLVEKEASPDGRNVLMQWSDKYGKGWLRISFSPDLQRFSGTWYSGSGNYQGTWDGIRH